LKEGKKILFEGAQATLLDIDHGTYPFVTSSNTTAGGACTGSGVGPTKINEVIGVVKAYTTRVGNGPFVTELFDEIAEKLREKGGEYGTTTGRPRRCGWLDTLVVRYAKRINNLDYIALTKLDVLTGLKELKICDSYNNNEIKEFPAEIPVLENAKPDLISMPGWDEDISKCKIFEELPFNAQNYIKRIEELTGVKIKFIGIGANRDEIIVREI